MVFRHGKALRLLAVITALAALFALVSCAGTEKPDASPDPSATPGGNARYTADGRRIITIGTFQDIYYVSKHDSIYADPYVPVINGDEDEEALAEKRRFIDTAEMKLAKLREIELKYNVVIEYKNLTFNGVMESVNTSIAEGVPDVDVYQVDTQFGVPAVLNGLGSALEDFLPADSAIFGGTGAVKGLKLTGQDKTYLFNAAKSGGTSAYPLAFNLDLILAAGLENPQDLYDRGEWTWDVWRQYLRTLTTHMNAAGVADFYGYGGYWTNMLSNLLMSNGASVAAGETQTFDSEPTREVLDFINALYNTDRTARPWYGPNWELNNRLYTEGLSGFWIAADWIFSEQGGADLPFEIGVVPWPAGPSGNPATNNYSAPDSTWFMIPQGAEDPALIYAVLDEWLDWYGGDDSVVTDDWSRNMYMNERNFGYAAMMSARQGFDLWDSLSKPINFSITEMLDGLATPEEIIDKFAPMFQAELDEYFGN
ncbi:MAG: ABC transporter substrate-binding protein [Oscillospiraceae bacterium]|jgi:hypothetical protein|nr:ABC transporter substrate-binding protein [Oscillospiraceae bacterium]